MLEKVIECGSWDRMDMQPSFLVPVKRAGIIGPNDLRNFLEKRAAAHVFEDMLSRVKLGAGDLPIHLIGVGATEAYGFNRNGDGFKEATCLSQYPTFMKHAKFYRNHKNKDPDKSYGKVALAAYNRKMRRIELLLLGNGTKEAAARNGGLVLPDSTIDKFHSGADIPVSMACKVAYDVCLYAGSLIETWEGLKPIETIREGEIVRTHTGTWSPVVTTFRREYAGAVTELCVTGLPERLRTTCSHPFPVVRNEVMKCTSKYRVQGELRNARHRFNGDDTCGQCKTQITELPYEWTDAQDIRTGDWLIYPIQEPGSKSVPRSEAYMAGLYAGDGFPIYTRRGRKRDGEKYLTGYRVSTENDAQFLAHVRELSGYHLPDYADKENGRILEHRDRDLANKFLTWIGQGCATKTIRQELFDWDEQSRWLFLAGCVDSDGNASGGKPRFLTTNRQLAYWVQRLLWGLGHNASCAKMPCTGDWAKAESYYQVSFDLSAAVKLRDYGCYKLRNCKEPDRPKYPVILDGYICLQVTETASRHDETDVFNLEVAGDNSYIYETAVHNCQNCFNKAAHRGEYCTEDTCINPHDNFRGLGCMHGLGKLASSGRQQGVENPNCIFFDMSEVVKPAERTAYGAKADYMSKAASAQDRHMSGAELAEWYAAQNGYEIQWGSPYRAVKLANQLAKIEQEIENNPMNERDRALARSVSPSKQAQADLTPLGKLGSSSAGTGLAALAGQKVALALPDFLRWISGEKGEKLASLVASVAPHVPGVFTRLAADPDLPLRARDSLYHHDTDTLAPYSQRGWADKMAKEASLSSPLVEERIQRSVIRNITSPVLATSGTWNKTAAAAAGPGEDLAQQYALYKLAFLEAQHAEENQLPLTLRLCVLQNYVC